MKSPSSSKYILLLGADQFQRERAVIAAKKATSLPIATLSPNAPFNANRFFDFSLRGNPLDGQSIQDAILCRQSKWDDLPVAIVPLNDWTVKAAAQASESLGLTTNPQTTVSLCRDKNLMKGALARGGIPVCTWARVSNVEGLRSEARRIGYPVVVKPLDFGGSGGVFRADSEADLVSRFEDTKRHVEAHGAKYGATSNAYLIEAYFEAVAEVSVEVLCSEQGCRAFGVTDKFLAAEPYFGEIGHSVPTRLSNAPQLEKLAEGACASLGLKVGVAHVEIRINAEGKQVVVEVGARTGGDGIMDLWEIATGVSPYQWHITSYLKVMPPLDFPRPERRAGIFYLQPEAGKLKNVSTHTPACPDGFEMHTISIPTGPGQAVGPSKDWSDRSGFILASCELGCSADSASEFLALRDSVTRDHLEIESQNGRGASFP